MKYIYLFSTWNGASYMTTNHFYATSGAQAIIMLEKLIIHYRTVANDLQRVIKIAEDKHPGHSWYSDHWNYLEGENLKTYFRCNQQEDILQNIFGWSYEYLTLTNEELIAKHSKAIQEIPLNEIIQLSQQDGD